MPMKTGVVPSASPDQSLIGRVPPERLDGQVGMNDGWHVGLLPAGAKRRFTAAR